MLKWYHPNPLIRLKAAVQLLNARLGSVLADAYQPAGISTLEGNVLSVIVSATTPLTIPQVARILGHSRQAVQGAVVNLKAAKLVRTARNPHHKRASLLLATEDGLAALEQAGQRADDMAMPILAQLDRKKVGGLAKELFVLLPEIEEAMLDVEGTAQFRKPDFVP